jgi:RNA polymerase sigma factor (sigma-70 family)
MAQPTIGEASLEKQMNRERANRYEAERSGYTFAGLGAMPPFANIDEQESVAAAYDAHYEVLRFIVLRRYRVPPPDVRPLIHDVFVRYLRHRAQIGDDRLWLAEATRNACRNYWRDRKPAEPLPVEITDSRQLADHVNARVDIARLLARVSPHCRALLRERYVEGREPAEIAERSHIATGTVRVRLHRCLEAMRAALASAGGRR